MDLEGCSGTGVIFSAFSAFPTGQQSHGNLKSFLLHLLDANTQHRVGDCVVGSGFPFISSELLGVTPEDQQECTLEVPSQFYFIYLFFFRHSFISNLFPELHPFLLRMSPAMNVSCTVL